MWWSNRARGGGARVRPARARALAKRLGKPEAAAREGINEGRRCTRSGIPERRLLLKMAGSATIAGLALGASACVVRPLYGTASDFKSDASGGAAGLATILILPIPGRRGQILHNELRDLLNPRGQPRDAAYNLEVSLRESVQESGRRRTETATRGTLTLLAEYRLFPRGAEEVVTRGRAQSIVGFNLVASGFADYVSRQSAQERAVREVAQEIRRRLALYLAQTAG